MSAKIKKPAPRHTGNHHPRGVGRQAFERVYWPFIPVVIALGIMLTLAIRTGSLSKLDGHGGHVLSYSLSENPQVMLADTNAERTANDEKPLEFNTELTAAAMSKAKDMAARDYWSHYTPDGTAPWAFVAATGYSYQKLGENLATGFSDEASVINGWMASQPHRQNLLDPMFTQVGFGFANAPHYVATNGGPSTIFVAFYGRPANALPVSTAISTKPGLAPTSTQPISPTLGSTTSQIQAGLNSAELATWAPVILVIAAMAAVGLLAGKHTRQILKVIRRGEGFAWHHPIFDLALVALVILAYSLWQTAGLIK